MLWFYESLFPVVWIAFLLYWRIRAAGTKTTQRLKPAASRILRALAFLIVIVLLSTTRIRCLGSTASSGRLASGPFGLELLLPSSAFSSPSGRASTSAAIGAAP